jgi:hypothetical protein
MSRRDEMETLLPFYLNGTLEAEEPAEVEAWLASDPDAPAALGEAEAEFSGTYASNEAIRVPADALSRFSRALDGVAGTAPAAGSLSLAARLWQRFMAVPAGVAWAAAAAAVALLLVQAVVEPGSGGGDFEIAGSGDPADMPFALVTFRPDSAVGDINAFLSGNGAEVISGPAAGGVFRIAIPATTQAEYDRLVGLIAAQPFAETVLPGRKPENGG